DVNHHDQEGRTPLMFACWKNRTKIIHMLLRHKGVDIMARNRAGMNAWAHAVQSRNIETCEMLISLGYCEFNMMVSDDYSGSVDDTLLSYIATDDDEGGDEDEEMLKYMLTKKFDINYKSTQEGHTALHRAAQCECIWSCKLLLTYPGIDVNAKTKKDKTPLQLADNIEIQKLLIAHGATVTDKKKYPDWKTYLPVWNRFTTARYFPKEFNTIALECLKSLTRRGVVKDVRYLILGLVAKNWKLE
ncbi:ankyrin repeat domain-containing protein, partial [Candidatus Babeliales bacterium]|nr:ankyrin repeat domain-containing protein [Candidatus Babeliales bacterium]